MTQRSRRWVALAALALLIPLLLNGCDALPTPQGITAVPVDGTITPTPTPDAAGYQSIAAESCLINDWPSLQTERRSSGVFYWQEGNLMAWKPDSDEPVLAYLAPIERSSWFTGALTVASGANLETHLLAAEALLATGDLTWSPDGEWLAFLAYRPSETLYTVMAVQPGQAGAAPLDLFSADLARTDNIVSRKAILGWRNDRTVQVVASCGEECRYAYDLRVPPAADTVLVPTTLPRHQQLNEALRPETRLQTVTPADYPTGMSRPYWSPDGSRIAYLDRRGLLWQLEPERKIHYILDIGLRDVYELRWDDTSSYLAVRAEDRIFVFQIPCQPSSGAP